MMFCASCISLTTKSFNVVVLGRVQRFSLLPVNWLFIPQVSILELVLLIRSNNFKAIVFLIGMQVIVTCMRAQLVFKACMQKCTALEFLNLLRPSFLGAKSRARSILYFEIRVFQNSGMLFVVGIIVLC